MDHHRSGHSSKSKSSTRPRVCRICGQHHSHHEPHLYNYEDEVDEDLMCQICLQPFVAPTDTPCSHTYCHACLNNYLKVNPSCPICRKPLTEMSCSPSNLVLKRLLDKLPVTCPNSDSCTEVLPRGNLDDHLRYRCSGTLVACQFASAGCDYRGPAKTMNKHQAECRFKKEGITRLPVLEGEVSHVEIPRTNASLGVTIVGGADTPLRCVVVQEVFPDGLIAQDGRLQPGDQIIEINGVDMTCASHAQVCAALRKMSSVLRLGVYRERIEKYSGRPKSSLSKSSAAAKTNGTNGTNGVTNGTSTTNGTSASNGTATTNGTSTNGTVNGAAATGQHTPASEELLTVTLERQTGRQLGVRLSGNCSESGIFIVDIQDGSTTATDGRLQKFDRLLFINGTDVRHCRLSQASALIQNNEKVSLVVARKKLGDPPIQNYDDDVATPNHTRSKSAPVMHPSEAGSCSEMSEDDDDSKAKDDEVDNRASSEELVNDHLYDVPEGADDYMAIYETLDRKRGEAKELKSKSHSMEALETPTPSLKSFDFSESATAALTAEKPDSAKPHHRRRHRSKGKHHDNNRRSVHEIVQQQQQVSPRLNGDSTDGGTNITAFLKKALRIEGPQLVQRPVTIKKNVRESLGMRIGGGIGSNEGDTPIYVANIHPHGCVGKSKQLKKGDILLMVNDTSLCGLTHSQAVATLKATISLSQVSLGVMDGPETSFGASNFIPSWMFWQKLPRSLQYPKTVILHRRENASWGFSIVGGADPGGGRPAEPIHVLFVVPESPASKDAKLRCGDRLLAVDGHSLENIPHSMAVSMLKQTSTRVVLEVVSWMGTEL